MPTVDTTSVANQQVNMTGGRHEDKLLLLLTLVIGAVVGSVVVAFIVLTENLGSRLYPPGDAAWRRVLIPVAGSLISGYLLYRYFPNARGSGIPQTKAALFLRDGFISFRTVLGKFGLCSLTLASGVALGREGPSVHVGAGIASALGRKLGLSPAGVRALVPSGSAAALAAAFNTPISAVLFTLEEVLGDLHAPVLGSIVLSSATSWIVLHLILGDEPLFHVPGYQLVHPIEFLFYAVLGLAGGLVSTAFVKLLLWQRRKFLALPKRFAWSFPVVGGLTVGILGWFFPEVLGVGYQFVSSALNGQMVVATMALLVVLKVVATATCYSSGNAGGIFGPSLFIGAMLGGFVAAVVHQLFPDYTGSVGAYALVGMGTAFAGIVRAPLTSVIMVFEITRDYSIVVPLMIANLISFFIAARLQKEPIYEALQHQDGIRLPSGAGAREDLLTVGHAFRPTAQALTADRTAAEALAAMGGKPGPWPVTGAAGFCGMISDAALNDAVRAGRGSQPLRDLLPESDAPENSDEPENTEPPFPHLYADDSLDAAMRKLAASSTRVLPVVSRVSPGELRGTVSLDDVVSAYASAGSGAAASPPPRNTRLLVSVVAAAAAVAVLGAFLNYYYRAERAGRALTAFREGSVLMSQERLPEAIEKYRYALSVSHSVDHRLALALALSKAGRRGEAVIYLNDVLRERPDSGPANEALAALAASEGRIDQAVTLYRKAIYGAWPGNAVHARVQARMQLIEMLDKAGRTAAAHAELLTLAAEVPDEPPLQKQLGHMLNAFGLPADAAALFRRLIKAGPPDSSEYDGLAQAEMLLGNYKTARTAFNSALALEPTDAEAARGVELCDQVLALDPTLRGLKARERYNRSRAILSRLAAERGACLPDGAPALQEARNSLARQKAPPSYSDAADDNLALARQLWSESSASCPPRSAADPLARVMSRLAAAPQN
jgi:chloride channel protein, CIC family